MNQRLEYIDCMRGIAMLMVVYCHVEGFCFNLKWPEIIASAISVPMLSNFFFISGLFTPPLLSYRHLKARALYLMLPTVAMFLLYVGAYYGNYVKLMDCVSDEYKWGYWFTFVLFLMNVIHYLVSIGLGKCEIQRKTIILLPLAILAMLLHVLKHWDWHYNGAFYCRWMCLHLLAMYFPYYVLGLACGLFRSKWHRVIDNEWITGAAVIIFVGMRIFLYGGSSFRTSISGVLGIFLLYKYCFTYREVFSEATFIGRQLSLIGRHTLHIYLIHYFFFIGLKMPWVGEQLNPASQWWLIAIISAMMTLVVVYSSLMVRKILSISAPLYRVLLGK